MHSSRQQPFVDSRGRPAFPLVNLVRSRRRGDRRWSVRRLIRTFPVWLALSLAGGGPGGGALGCGAARGAEPISFSRDVRPILADNCFACHGPDAERREGDLRLDQEADARAERDGGAAITPGDPASSLLIARITTANPDERMPPADSGKTLSPEQIDILKRWIAAGAAWEQHWAFVPPGRPELPDVPEGGWVRNGIDAFVLDRLRREDLAPSPPADAVTLFRRLTFDLAGLPPTPEEVEAALADTDRFAVDRQIERLLQSPHFGEKWARHWLDAARYADSDGFEKDKPRLVWFYRDYVIDAFNSDLPYNQFLIEQLAGDLLPDATQSQRVATGFLRNSMINEEGGVDPEQFRMEAMYDRMDAIGKAMLGLTIQCAQCHTHKYDPIAHVDYYRLFAYINNCHEGQATVYTDPESKQRQQILAQIAAIEAELKGRDPAWAERMQTWEASQAGPAADWTIVRPTLDASGGQKHSVLDDGSILASGYAPTKHTTEFTVTFSRPRITALRLELLNDPNLPHGGPGRAPDGLCALSEFQAIAAPLDDLDQPQMLKFSGALADVNPPERELAAMYHDKTDKRRVTGPIGYAVDGNNETAWGLDIGGGRSNVARQAVFTLETPLENPAGWQITFKLVQMHGGWNSDDNQNNNLGRFRFTVTEDAPPADPLVPLAVQSILAIPRESRTAEQNDRLFSDWRTTVPEWQAANDAIEDLWQSHPHGTSQLVLIERDVPRETHRLDRGDFLKPREVVEPGVPEFLHPLPEGAPASRLGLARWIADERSPTTARSMVNRIWQAMFGIGLVETVEDFGFQGSPPSHPELLDWLAVEFVENNWSVKHIVRLIATSNTYRQSSRVTPALYARDPYNRLLARGPRFRVDAESVRDVALAVSGLLNPAVGGPSVYPPAPEFLFAPPASYGPKTWAYKPDAADQYRRGLYTFRFRSVPYPMLQTFDAPNADVACVRRSRSNTPLQALTTLNEPLFVACAQALARKAIVEGGDDAAARLTFAFRRCLSRSPHREELNVLTGLYRRQVERCAEGSLNPAILFGATGDDRENPPPPEGATVAELAGLTAVCRVLLNLDETITKE